MFDIFQKGILKFKPNPFMEQKITYFEKKFLCYFPKLENIDVEDKFKILKHCTGCQDAINLFYKLYKKYCNNQTYPTVQEILSIFKLKFNLPDEFIVKLTYTIENEKIENDLQYYINEFIDFIHKQKN